MAANLGRLCLALPLALAALTLAPPLAPAHAQVTAEVELQTDYRTRGYSLSDERPVATASVGYDHLSGFYLGGSLTGVWADDEPRLLTAQGYAGYAFRLSPDLAADAGVVQTHYGSANSFGRSIDYTEFYAGVSGANLSSHLFYSPDYYGLGLATLYGQVEGSVELAPRVSLHAHLGHLQYLEQPAAYRIPSRQDWRLAAVRRAGATTLSLAASGRIQRGDHRDTALVAGIVRAF